MTKDKFINAILFRDLGYSDNKKNLFIEDRIDNMIIVSGENVYSEIENTYSILNIQRDTLLERNRQLKAMKFVALKSKIILNKNKYIERIFVI